MRNKALHPSENASMLKHYFDWLKNALPQSVWESLEQELDFFESTLPHMRETQTPWQLKFTIMQWMLWLAVRKGCIWLIGWLLWKHMNKDCFSHVTQGLVEESDSHFNALPHVWYKVSKKSITPVFNVAERQRLNEISEEFQQFEESFQHFD